VFEEYPAVGERKQCEYNTTQQAAFGAPKPMASRNGSNAAQSIEMGERSRHVANNAAMVSAHDTTRALECTRELQGRLTEGADNGVVESF
jgi:vacuolar-type H+-ATPase catalytic subunit A/Vma1